MVHFNFLPILLVILVLFNSFDESASRRHRSRDRRIRYFRKDAITQLTDSNFQSVVLESDENWLVAFYSPWCIHSKRLAPKWYEAAQILEAMNTTELKIGAVDCATNQIMDELVIEYPTIFLFPHGNDSLVLTLEDHLEDYSADEILLWAFENLDTLEVARKSEEEIEDDETSVETEGMTEKIETFMSQGSTEKGSTIETEIEAETTTPANIENNEIVDVQN